MGSAVEIFNDRSDSNLKSQINEWLKKYQIEVINVSYSVTHSNGVVNYFALVAYRTN